MKAMTWDLTTVDKNKIYNYVDKFNRNDEECVKQKIDNAHAYDWMMEQVPYFECPDKEIEETYYFRWWVYRKHIKETPEGYIITEFHPDVEWAGAYNSINAASGHHLAEGRWLKDGNRYMEDYIRFWLRGSGNQFSYSSWLAYAVYEYCLVKKKEEFGVGLLGDLVAYYRHIEATNMTEYGLFWSNDDRDAMELSVSGSGLRPTLNSYMYANAYAISCIAEWAGKDELDDEFKRKAASLKEKICNVLWDEKDEFFKVIPLENVHGTAESFSFRQIPAEHNVREAIGYIPWCFDIPDKEQDAAWKFLMNEQYFKADYGPLTAERNHPLFMKKCEFHECVWNGPSWPFATTQILNGMITTLQKGPNPWISAEDFYEQLRIYTRSHYRTTTGGRVVNWIDENLNPDTGKWLSRSILEEWGWREDKGGYERGKDYNHSGYCDIIIRGLCGVQIMEDDRLVIHTSLIPENWDYFSLRELPYKGHTISVQYDRDGMHYGGKKGLTIMIDGAHADITKIYIDELSARGPLYEYKL